MSKINILSRDIVMPAAFPHPTEFGGVRRYVCHTLRIIGAYYIEACCNNIMNDAPSTVAVVVRLVVIYNAIISHGYVTNQELRNYLSIYITIYVTVLAHLSH